MKTFKQHISEAQALFKTDSMIFTNLESPALILSPSMIERVFDQERIEAWHVTDINGLKGLQRIEGKKSSISVLTEIESGKVKIFSMGVETGGGYCVKLEGNLLLSSDIDVYSERLEGGRRAIAVGTQDYPSLYKDMMKMIKSMWDKFGFEQYTGDEYVTAMDFNKWGMALKGKQKAQFIKEYIDNSEIILKKNKKAREELRKIGRHKFSTYNESVVNQIKIKTIYVINNNTMEKFGSQYQAAKKLFKNVLEVTSDRMGEIVSK